MIKGKKAQVAFGEMLIMVDVARLKAVSSSEYRQATRPTTARTVVSVDIRERKLNFRDHIDVRGMRASEALEAVEDKIWHEQLCDVLEDLLEDLPEKSRNVLRLRYYQNMTLEECGGVLGVGAERVRQMENKGLRFLRQPKNAACLRPFFDFNFFCYTGMSAFLNSGMSVQERYLIAEEEQQRKAEARRQKREQRRREERSQSEYEEIMDRAMQEVQETVARMTPEEKRALLAQYGLA